MDTIEVKTKINIEAIESMLVTALEGGSNYWYELNSADLKQMRKWLNDKIEKGELQRNKSIHYDWMDAIFQGYPKPLAIYETEEVYDNEGDFSEFEPLGYLSMDNIRKGLELASKDYPEHYNEFFPEYDNGDSTNADVIFQLIVMGDIVFG